MSTPPPTAHDCHDLSPAQHVDVAERALAEGDLGHAMLHVASALSFDPLDAQYRALLDRLYARADDPLALVPFESGTSYAIVAVRADVLARRGQHGEALELLFRVAQVRPELPYLAWAEAWLGEPGVAASLDPARLADPVGRWVLDRRGRDGAAALRAGFPALERLVAAHRGAVDLRYWHAAALRKMGDLDRALEEALSLAREHPSLRSAVAVAMVQREKGDVDGAVEAFVSALAHEPDDVSVRLDLGDMLCAAGRVDEGLRFYDEVLALEPEQPWALPSALYQRAIRGDAAAAEALRLMTFNAPGNRRAEELAARLPVAEQTVKAKPKTARVKPKSAPSKQKAGKAKPKSAAPKGKAKPKPVVAKRKATVAKAKAKAKPAKTKPKKKPAR